DHTVDRFARVVGMQGAKDEQAGLGGGKSEGDGLEVAHFSDEHDVAILAQGGLETGRESGRVLRDFALSDDAELVVMHKLDRLLNRDNVPGVGRVNVINQGRERGRLPGSGRAGDKDESASEIAELL